MFRSTRLSLTLLFAGIFLSVMAVAALPDGSAAASSEAVLSVVASNLDHPRGLAFGPDGGLYIAESGLGGPSPCIMGPDGSDLCYGPTGAVTRVLNGVQERVIDDLPSLNKADLSEGIGPQDIAFDENGDMFILIGLGSDPAVTAPGGALEGLPFAHIVEDTGGGTWAPLVDLAPFEADNNPDGGVVDTNPFSLLSSTSGHMVADAGGNSLLSIAPDNTITTTAVFPDVMVEFPPGSGNMIPMQAVPTSVVVGPDSAYYVGQLTGFPFPVGGANVFRVEPGQPVTVEEDSFTNILDIDYDNAGNLYVLEMAAGGLLNTDTDPRGALIKVAPDGTRTTIAMDGLVLPTGMVVGPDNAIYVSNYGVFSSAGVPSGEVVRINMAPTSVSLSGIEGQSGLTNAVLLLLAVAMAAFAGAYLFWRRGRVNG